MHAVIAVLGIKGGIGKTTTAVNLAGVFATRLPTLLIDCDPQDAGSSTAWLGANDRGVDVVKVRDSAQLDRLLDAWSGLAIIDTPRADDPLTRGAIRRSSFVVLPTGASQEEVAAAYQSSRLVPEGVLRRALLTRVDGRLHAPAAAAARALEALDVPRLTSYVRHRNAHVRAQEHGAPTIDLRSSDRAMRDAADDYRRVGAEILQLLGMSLVDATQGA